MPRQNVYVQGEQILDCRVGSRVLASCSLQGDTRVFHTLTLGVAPQGGGACTGAGSYPEGTAVTIQAVPASGYVFVKWSDENTNATRSITLNEDKNLTAHFESVSKKIRLFFPSSTPAKCWVDDAEVAIQTMMVEGYQRGYADVTANVGEPHKVDVTLGQQQDFISATKNGSALVEISEDQTSWGDTTEEHPFYVRLKNGASGTSQVDVMVAMGF